jgi:hypothetical protein
LDKNAVPKEEKHTISRRNVLEALGTGIIASGVIACTRHEDAAQAFDYELTPELYYSSVRALASAIRSREVSSVEVVQAFLDRIETVNVKINAKTPSIPQG